MTRLDGFNRVVRIYDYLKRFVFGSAIFQSEARFLKELPPSGSVLILGGGSGEILVPLMREYPAVRIWYVDASSAMLRRARKNVSAGDLTRIEFIHGTEQSIPSTVVFDAVVTHFFLDLFSEARLAGICERVSRQLRNGGIWLVSDFVKSGHIRHRLLLWLMYRFFGATSGIEAKGLPPWERFLAAQGMDRKACAKFYGGFIRSSVFKKTASLD